MVNEVHGLAVIVALVLVILYGLTWVGWVLIGGDRHDDH